MVIVIGIAILSAYMLYTCCAVGARYEKNGGKHEHNSD